MGNNFDTEERRKKNKKKKEKKKKELQVIEKGKEEVKEEN